MIFFIMDKSNKTHKMGNWGGYPSHFSMGKIVFSYPHWKKNYKIRT